MHKDKGKGGIALILGKMSDKDEPKDEGDEDSLEVSERFMNAAKDVRELANDKMASDEDFALALKNAIHLCMNEY